MWRRKAKSKNVIVGRGYKAYRSPLVYNAPKKVKKEPKNLPPIKLSYIVWLIIFLLIIYFIFLSGKFKIKDIMVEGNHLISTDKITSYIPYDSNILFFNSSKTKAKILKENPEIMDVRILRGLPDAIKIVVLEHENKIIWQTGGISYLVSTQGEVTKQIEPGETFDYPIVIDSKNISVSPGDYIVSPSFIAFTTNLYQSFFNTTNIKPTTFEIPETTFDLYLHTEAGFYVKFNTMRSSAKQLENLKKVLVEKRQDIHEYVDLRIDGWAYYK